MKASKDINELLFWEQLYNKFTRGCVDKQCKDKKCLQITTEITFPRYRQDLFLNDSSFVGQKIIDIGCGPNGGLFGFLGCSKYGIDHLLDSYRDIGYPLDQHDINYYQMKSESIEFEAGFFNTAICVNALDHVDNLDKTISEISRVLAKGGKFIGQLNFRKEPTVTEPICLDHEYICEEFLKNGLTFVEKRFQYSLKDQKEDRYYYEFVKK